jgi:hypothetical protein
MIFRYPILLAFVAVSISAGAALARSPASANANAALRYWSAFSVMQDSAITADQAAQLNAVLNGRAQYENSKFSQVIEKNKLALEIMTRAVTLPECDWGLDYSMGSEEPVEYARNALALGRLNVLHALQLLHAGDKDAAVTALAAGLHFSRDVANGGTLFATLIADQLISEHLRAAAFAVRQSNLSSAQRWALQNAVAHLGSDGLDWRSAVDREFQVMRAHFPDNAQASAALTRMDGAYAKALHDSSALSALQDAIRSAPPDVAQLIPIPSRVIEKKNALAAQIAQTRSSLR